MIQSGNLRRAKQRLMSDPELSRLLVRSGWNEIMIDLNQDGNPDACFSDENGDGDIDTIAIDLTGSGEFNLFLHDADGNGIPDTILYMEDNAQEPEVIATGSQVEDQLKELAERIYRLLVAEEFLNNEVGISLTDLSQYLKEDLAGLLAEVQRITNLSGVERVCAFLETAGVYYLATEEGDQPRVRPFGTALVYEDKLYIQTGKVKDVSKQLAENPKAEICAFAEGIWIRIAGELVNDDRIEVKKAMLDKHPNLRRMYDEKDDNTQVLYFKDAKAVFYSFTDAPEVIDL